MLPSESPLSYNVSLNANSSGSSDTETPLEEKGKYSKNAINKQWEAIERTLYQETGQQVTDADLLKECKLWRNTFPHFRVKGCQLNIKQTQNLKENDKNIEALKSSFSFNKLNEKRENFKKTVVDSLVERLITKFDVNKLSVENKSVDNLKRPGAIPGTHDNCANGIFRKCNTLTEDNENENTFEISEKNKDWKNNLPTLTTESYFERGKLFDSLDEIDKEFKRDTIEEKYYEMFDILEKELKEKNFSSEFETKNLSKPKSSKKEKFEMKSVRPPEGEVIGIDLSEKSIIGRRRTPLPDPPTHYIKPVEIKTKINKKYEGLLSKIINKKTGELDSINHCRTHSSGNIPKSSSEFPENIRFDPYPEECNITLPKINKFNNNWLNREVNADHIVGDYQRNCPEKFKKNLAPNFRELMPDDIDEKFMNDLKKEMLVRHRRTSMRFEGAEKVNFRQPKIYSHMCEHTHKSLSCGDLPKKNKNSQKKQTNGILGNGMADANLKLRSKSTNLNHSKPKKLVENKKGLLPPIESGIIITELTGRPKIGPKIPSKKR